MSVILPETSRPTNLHFHDDVEVRMIDSDVYGICERVRKIDPNLFIIVAGDASKHSFIIMEKCKDGVDRKVFSTDSLDARVIDRLEYLMHRPLAERMAVLEKEEAAAEAARQEAIHEDLYERLGGPMRRQLWHDGFVEHRDKSYPIIKKRN